MSGNSVASALDSNTSPPFRSVFANRGLSEFQRFAAAGILYTHIIYFFSSSFSSTVGSRIDGNSAKRREQSTWKFHRQRMPFVLARNKEIPRANFHAWNMHAIRSVWLHLERSVSRNGSTYWTLGLDRSLAKLRAQRAMIQLKSECCDKNEKTLAVEDRCFNDRSKNTRKISSNVFVLLDRRVSEFWRGEETSRIWMIVDSKY